MPKATSPSVPVASTEPPSAHSKVSLWPDPFDLGVMALWGLFLVPGVSDFLATHRGVVGTGISSLFFLALYWKLYDPSYFDGAKRLSAIAPRYSQLAVYLGGPIMGSFLVTLFLLPAFFGGGGCSSMRPIRRSSTRSPGRSSH